MAIVPVQGSLAAQSTAEVVREAAPSVERLAARTRPAGWPMLRSCLYYALAGQRFLADRGIPTRLRRGLVVYAPGTPSRHGIRPHYWLESPTHLIDFATLPRWGSATAVPLERVARHPAAVAPGDTPILAGSLPCGPACLRELGQHRRRLASGCADVPTALPAADGTDTRLERVPLRPGPGSGG